MKRLFFLLIVAVACVLPQSVWADDENTLTITSDAAGSLANGTISLAGVTNKASITKIVLSGYFNEDDLKVIKGVGDGAEFTKVSEVDMAEAQFVSSSGGSAPSSYVWFPNDPDNPSAKPVGYAAYETHAYKGGSLYQLRYPRTWVEINTTPTSNITNYASISAMEADKNGDVGRYARTTKYIYRQMSLTNVDPAWTQSTTKDSEGKYFVRPAGPVYEVDWLEKSTDGLVDNKALHNKDFVDGDVIRVYEYWRYEGSDTWVKCYPSASELEGHAVFNESNGGTYGELHGVSGITDVGDYYRFNLYFTKHDTRSWGDAQDNAPSSPYTPKATDDFADSDRDNYMRGYDNGDWARMVTYVYYRLQTDDSNESARIWDNVTTQNGRVDNITYHFASESDLDSHKGYNNGTYAIVGGTEYVYDGVVNTETGLTGWVLASEHTYSGLTFNYSQMKFEYWSDKLTTATTSRHANESISDGIFSNCKSLKTVYYLGGNVTGFGDHKTSAGYDDGLTITIGKDVTKISNAAFRRCDVLKTVNWGPYAAGDAQSMVYPKELVIENEAFLHAKNLMSITIPNRVTYIGDKAFEQVGTGVAPDINNVKNNPNAYNYTFTLTFERRNANDTDQGPVAISCDKPLTIGNDAFLDCWFLKKLSLPIRLEEMGEGCFANTINLEELEMREETKASYTPPTGHDLLRTIPNRAFYDSGIKNLTIPKCVTKIEKHAFADTEYLEKITFQGNLAGENYPLIIESGAFTEGREEGRPQLDVYVMVNPNQRKIICEYQAFNFTQTVGQTSTSTTTPSFAYLHFPEEYWDYYQGNWKRGLAFRQDNLNAFKDGYYKDNDDDVPDCIGKSAGFISTSSGKYETGDPGTIYTPGNGWQEFARTSTTIDIVIPNTGSFLRTYSTKTPKAIPLYAEDDAQQGVHKGEPFFKVYRISHFDDKWSGSGSAPASDTPVATATEVKVHNDDASHAADNYTNAYIPKNTGLLMAGFGNGSVSYIVYMADIDDNDNLKTYPWNRSQDTQVVSDPNLLYPTCDDDPHTTRTTVDGVEYVVLNPTYPYPYASNTVPDYRFFGLAATSGTPKTYYFSRFIKNGKSTRDKAYLKLSNDVFHWTDEGSTASNSGLNNSSTARVALNFVEDDEEGETTSIKLVDTEKVKIADDSYYTLQGAKLNGCPTQRGIYIHNGRKVIVK